jgi:hypothetical protein
MWKFNASLTKDAIFTAEACIKLDEWLNTYRNEIPKLKFDLLKYEFKKFARQYSMKKAKDTRELETKLEAIVKEFETNPNPNDTAVYDDAKLQFETLHNKKIEGQILRSKCAWYEHGEKSSKYFLSLEKSNAIQSSVRVILDENEVELNDGENFLGRLRKFYSALFEKKTLLLLIRPTNY